MDEVINKISASQPELYAILAVLVYGIKKIVPILNSGLETMKSHLASSQRTEKNTEDNLAETRQVNAALKTLATKDDMIGVLLNGVKPPMDSVSKQESVNGKISL